MKKLMILTLALVMTLSLCACGSSKSSDTAMNPFAPNSNDTIDQDNGNVPDNTEEITEPAPTEEEHEMLRQYAELLNQLSEYGEYGFFSISGDSETYYASEALAYIYQQLQTMGAIDEWIEKPGYLVENYNVREETYRTRQELLSNFSVMNDVCFGFTGSSADQLGNEEEVCRLSVYLNQKGQYIRMREEWTDAFAQSTDILIDQQLWGNALEQNIIQRAGIDLAYDQEFIYDEQGRLVTVMDRYHKVDGTSDPDETLYGVVNVTYNEAGRIAALENIRGNNVPNVLAYTYDEQGNLHLEPESHYAGKIFTYDASYDEMGRITEETFQELSSYNRMPTEVETAAYTYDSNGRLETMVYHHSTGLFSGTREQENVYNYQYDAQGRLISVEINQGASVTNGEVFEVDKAIEVTFHWGDYYFYNG